MHLRDTHCKGHEDLLIENTFPLLFQAIDVCIFKSDTQTNRFFKKPYTNIYEWGFAVLYKSDVIYWVIALENKLQLHNPQWN